MNKEENLKAMTKKEFRSSTVQYLPEIYNKRLATIICHEKNIPQERLLEKTREREIVESRQIYMYMLIEIFKIGPSEIGRRTGFDHATVFHSKKKVNEFLETERRYRESFERILPEVKEMKRHMDGEVPQVSLSFVIRAKTSRRLALKYKTRLGARMISTNLVY